MKKFNIFIILTSILVFASCHESDPCDVQHVLINGECIPDYIFPNNQGLRSGDKFYHPKFGVVIYKDSLWFDENNRPITELNDKSEEIPPKFY